MGLFDKIRERKEGEYSINKEEELLKAWVDGRINETEYKQELAKLELEMKRKKYDREKITIGKIATGIITSTANSIFTISGSSIKPFNEKK